MLNDIHKPRPIVSTANAEVDLLNPLVSQIHAEDIALALSRVVRYSGHSATPFTVGQHTLLCRNIAVRMLSHKVGSQTFDDVVDAVTLHDAHEAYTGDIARPLKMLLNVDGAIDRLENRLDAVIRARFSPKYWPTLKNAVKEVDNAALSAEVHAFFPAVLGRWGSLPDPHPDDVGMATSIGDWSQFEVATSILHTLRKMEHRA